MKIHMVQWFTGDPEVRSRKGTLADTKVKSVKDSKAAKVRENVILNRLPVENVACFDYLGSTFNAGGGSVEDIEENDSRNGQICQTPPHLGRCLII